MLQRIREQMGTAGLVVAIVALVAALAGGAYAANASKAHHNKSKAGKRGPRGFTGKTGPAGPQGPKGDTGAAGVGTKGDPGDPGKSVNGTPIAAAGACGAQTGVKYSLDGTDTNVCNGATGGNGTSVTNTAEPVGAHCAQGGAKLQVGAGTPTYACNGSATGKLPVGATETGTWVMSGTDAAALSFPIPLASAPAATNVHLSGDSTAVDSPGGNFATHCGGSAAAPAPDSGHLCVYVQSSAPDIADGESAGVFAPDLSPPFPGILNPGAATSGAIVRAGGYSGLAYGTWAVTG